ncbi:hypothetical protein FC758_01240 [Clostridium botulinum]|nr:hypothetical protein [Clostridium botulinum]
MKSKMIVEGNIYVAGVYQMRTKNGVVLYVGSAIEINDALSSRHLYNLKRGKYADTNKRILQDAYDREDLIFEVIHKSAFADEVRNMTMQQKEDLQKALGVLEEFYIDLYKDTVCNSQYSVTKHSSSPNAETTLKRRIANKGTNNPNCKYDEVIISEILYFKLMGYKPKKIMNLIQGHYEIEIGNSYISQIGVKKWIYTEPIKPIWYESVEV